MSFPKSQKSCKVNGITFKVGDNVGFQEQMFRNPCRGTIGDIRREHSGQFPILVIVGPHGIERHSSIHCWK